ncbi:MAG: hypothetical protein KUG69_07590, partial [Marinosulfonomonas sp.]|nr:hypothetical protein [Marinosulfonomonas sp.]
FYFRLARLADQLLYRWHSGYFPVLQHISIIGAPYKHAQKHKNRMRSLIHGNDAGGFPEDRDRKARIMTTSV